MQNLASPPRAIRIAVLAMGGEGGGVLAKWLIDLAEKNGHVAQMTSVPGVAQRTGATVYYIEMFPEAALKNGQLPVLAQMPTPGDVDLVVASELMEAGRAIQRGIVTPDRTTLIASTHRVFAMTEKIALADGRVDAEALMTACRTAAREFIAYDMMALAEKSGSVISAVLFGAIAAAKVLPFPREAFEKTIREGGKGANASLRAFAAAFDPKAEAAPEAQKRDVTPAVADFSAFPADIQDILRAGHAQCRDWQDDSYARLYLERLKPFVALEKPDESRLLGEVARQLALAMTYEDTIRVADLKIRASRFARVSEEVGLKQGQLLQIREYLHPRAQEIAETLPGALGRMVERPGLIRNAIESLTSEGKIVETSSVRGFLMLYMIAGLRRWRRANSRYASEQASIEGWLTRIRETVPRDGALAVEVAAMRTLVKGYSDTHKRGYEKFDRLSALVPKLSGQNAAETLAKLVKAALADEEGKALDTALKVEGLA